MNKVIKNELMNIIKKPELLAPAGDFERMKWAFLYGADAVYIGGPILGLRANAINFSLDNIKEAVTYAHSIGKKIYVTVNITLHNKELDELENYLQSLDVIGVDAIIASDPTVIDYALKHTNLVVHLSTQASTMNYEALDFWKNLGVSRVVTAREVSEEDLKIMTEKVDIEIETFIHGAMCASISGRCVLSNFLTARDANRGGCSQICRWSFNLYDENYNKLNKDVDFTFCTKDLIMLNHIPKLIEMGISSFKIEGRMRSIYYIATVVSIYRKIIDEYCNDPSNYKYNSKYENILMRCANREMIPQFFDTSCNKSYQYYNGREEISNQDFIGVILGYDKSSNLAFVEQRNYFKKGDLVEVFGPDGTVVDVEISEIYDENKKLITVVKHPLQKVYLKISEEVGSNYLIRKKKFNTL